MKRVLFLIIPIFCLQFISAQEQASQSKDTIYDYKVVDVKPEYPGGVEAFYKFIAKNYRAPEQEGLNGKIITTFVIEKDGSISDIRVLQDIGYNSRAEVFKVLSMCAKWSPAKLNNVPVRVLYQFPITVKSADKYPRKSK
jgi:periplasmic protein TonB